MVFPGGSMVKTPPANEEDLGSTLGWEDLLEKEVAAFPDISLANPMDRGAWWTRVHGLQKSWT